jgi:hypothetical protein
VIVFLDGRESFSGGGRCGRVYSRGRPAGLRERQEGVDVETSSRAAAFK